MHKNLLTCEVDHAMMDGHRQSGGEHVLIRMRHIYVLIIRAWSNESHHCMHGARATDAKFAERAHLALSFEK